MFTIGFVQPMIDQVNKTKSNQYWYTLNCPLPSTEEITCGYISVMMQRAQGCQPCNCRLNLHIKKTTPTSDVIHKP